MKAAHIQAMPSTWQLQIFQKWERGLDYQSSTRPIIKFYKNFKIIIIKGIFHGNK